MMIFIIYIHIYMTIYYDDGHADHIWHKSIILSPVSGNSTVKLYGICAVAWERKLYNTNNKPWYEEINSQSLEDKQVGYISQKYSFDKYTLGQAFKPSYTFSSI